MLDFYLLADSQSKSGLNHDLKYLGGIQDDLFFQLQQEGIVEPWLDYYRDFRWGSEIVNKMLLKLLQKSAASQRPARLDFIAILQKAADARSGIVAKAD
ncbi:hypothetical protein LGH70_06100 [Hymenobacter sp. BT635]|uniref:Uncharacterized protein n=1 Tax=Hymenobacter nitidus TaxID=2880929 RepID=A0ABS8A9S4_9BACT|nr:hypothetical protein [Hymenobacter nitidus]MCB2377145.1 hypothetical protein [Hymenobacter nitidus]